MSLRRYLNLHSLTLSLNPLLLNLLTLKLTSAPSFSSTVSSLKDFLTLSHLLKKPSRLHADLHAATDLGPFDSGTFLASLAQQLTLVIQSRGNLVENIKQVLEISLDDQRIREMISECIRDMIRDYQEGELMGNVKGVEVSDEVAEKMIRNLKEQEAIVKGKYNFHTKLAESDVI